MVLDCVMGTLIRQNCSIENLQKKSSSRSCCCCVCPKMGVHFRQCVCVCGTYILYRILTLFVACPALPSLWSVYIFYYSLQSECPAHSRGSLSKIRTTRRHVLCSIHSYYRSARTIQCGYLCLSTFCTNTTSRSSGNVRPQ